MSRDQNVCAKIISFIDWPSFSIGFHFITTDSVVPNLVSADGNGGTNGTKKWKTNETTKAHFCIVSISIGISWLLLENFQLVKRLWTSQYLRSWFHHEPTILYLNIVIKVDESSVDRLNDVLRFV